MPRTRSPYPAEFRVHMIELVRSGRTPEELSREFEPTAQSIWNWVRQAERDPELREALLRAMDPVMCLLAQGLSKSERC